MTIHRGLPREHGSNWSQEDGLRTSYLHVFCPPFILQSGMYTSLYICAYPTVYPVQAERRVNPQNTLALGRDGLPEAEASADVAAPSLRGPRQKVPLLNLSTESLRMSVEAITPPCSFPVRGQVSSHISGASTLQTP